MDSEAINLSSGWLLKKQDSMKRTPLAQQRQSLVAQSEGTIGRNRLPSTPNLKKYSAANANTGTCFHHSPMSNLFMKGIPKLLDHVKELLLANIILDFIFPNVTNPKNLFEYTRYFQAYTVRLTLFPNLQVQPNQVANNR